MNQNALSTRPSGPGQTFAAEPTSPTYHQNIAVGGCHPEYGGNNASYLNYSRIIVASSRSAASRRHVTRPPPAPAEQHT
jgi:hypothetical protein